ncbi:MAG TPA: GlsB/YeaQ/YmgE family stress response membrane protein [Candidatus Limnocylindria bacterium]|nr:GlsB/YeaQ/YmgE family stress response membrane protein [Candidatus Limnocylindria bacterium]
MDLTAIITWIIFGAVVGVIARFLMPGRDPMGWAATILLGIVGSFVGGFLAQLLFAGSAALPPPSAGWIGSIVGAIIVLAVYRYTQGRRVTV